MSDFAKAQLLKYGWVEGKGLGKNEDGISEALRPKLKFDKSGIGHKDSNFEWWNSDYDKALKNIVSTNQSDQSTIETAREYKSDSEIIEKPKIQKKKKYGQFLKTSTLCDGQLITDSSCDVEENPSLGQPLIRISDEALFKACGGRTAHKGARHGLTLNGKLARVAEQERQLLAASFSKSEEKKHHQNKKKKKHKHKSNRPEDVVLVNDHALNQEILDSDYQDDCSSSIEINHHAENHKLSKHIRKKIKRNINNLTNQLTKLCSLQDDNNDEKLLESENNVDIHKSKNHKKNKSKRKRSNECTDDVNNILSDDDVLMEPDNKKKRKSELDMTDLISSLEQCVETASETNETNKINIHENQKITSQNNDCSENYDSSCSMRKKVKKLNAKIKKKKKSKWKKKKNFKYL